MKSVIVMALLASLALAAPDGTKGSVTGRIVDERGKAVAGARVHAEAGGGAADVTSDEKGGFRIELDAGTYQLTITADGYGEVSLNDSVRVEAGKQTRIKERIALRDLSQPSVVRGSVFSNEGRSLAGAKVVLEPEGGEGRKRKLESRTDHMGIFTFRVPKGMGRYVVTASLDGYTPASQTVEVSGGELTNIAIKLAAGPGRP
jgi:uncharacterized membrane protein